MLKTSIARKEKKMKKRGIFLVAAMASLFLVTPQQVDAAAKLEIQTPSQEESMIAPGRSFYVSGDLSEYTYQSGDTMTITISEKNAPTNPVRTSSTNIFKNQSLYVNENGETNFPVFFSGTTKEDILASGMPDLIYDSAVNGSLQNGAAKCYFDDQEFTALIPGGAVPIGMEDKMNLKDESGNAYTPLAKGEYVITVTIEKADGTVEASVQKDLTIGVTSDKVLARFSPQAQLEAVQKFAQDKGYRMYEDPFPGYWNFGESKFCEIAPEWKAADAMEYTEGTVHFVIYNVKGSSTTYSVELGTLEKMKDIDDPERLVNYYYSTGEPTAINGQTGSIVPFAAGDKLQIVRAETSTQTSDDGVYNQDKPTAQGYDFDLSDGMTAKVGETVSFYGVTAPIQIEEKDIVSSGQNSYTLNNKITTLSYHITGTGIDEKVDKQVTLNRKSGGWDNYSELEFKHTLLVTEAMAGKDIQVQVEGFDKYGQAVNGTKESFTVKVAAVDKEEKPVPPVDKDTSKPSPSKPSPSNPPKKVDTQKQTTASKSPKTGDNSQVIGYIIALGAAGVVAVGSTVYVITRNKKRKNRNEK